MRAILLLLSALITSVVIVGCGPAVGRAVGDTKQRMKSPALLLMSTWISNWGISKKNKISKYRQLRKISGPR